MWNFPLVTKFVFLGAFIHWILTGELLSLADAQALIMSPTHSHTLTATNATPQTSNSDDTVMTTTTTAAAVTPSVEVEIEIDLEVYLSGIASLPRELSRLCVNSIRCGNYSLPPRINSFVSDLYSGFRLLNLRNGALRKKFDSIKYDLQKLEEIMYDIAVRKLTDDKKQAGETDQ